MKYFYSIVRYLNNQLGEAAQSMDTAGWCALAVVTVVVGFFFLRGNVLRST